MIINDNFIFIHIPKTAGNSIQDSLGYPRPNKFPGHISLNELQQQVDIELINERFKFTVVRNTWDRVLSLHSHMTQKSKMYEDWKQMGFNEWVCKELENTRTHERWGKKVFTTPQLEWIMPGVDFICRFEYLEEDFNKVCKKLNVKATLGYQTRTRTTHKPYREIYSQEARDVVAKVFSKDIKYFEHEF